MQQATVLTVKGKKTINILKFHLKAKKLQVRSSDLMASLALNMTFLALYLAITDYVCVTIHSIKLNIMKKEIYLPGFNGTIILFKYCHILLYLLVNSIVIVLKTEIPLTTSAIRK